MKYRTALFVVLVLLLLLAGCQKEENPINVASQPTEPEPTATYDWMAGESPVSVKRIGVARRDGLRSTAAISPTGVYFLYEVLRVYGQTPPSPVILYWDHGSDTVIRLCGRADCPHDTEDCNAYVDGGDGLTYYNGYLYVLSDDADGSSNDKNCKLLRMDPDGTNRVQLYDFGEFAREHDADYARIQRITEGYLNFYICKWTLTDSGMLKAQPVETYIYKLDGSEGEPRVLKSDGSIIDNCGEVTLAYSAISQNGGEYGSYWDWDPATDTLTYLADHPGVPGWFGKDQAFYFKDGAVRRLTYATGEEEVVIETGLEGTYYPICLPDCIIVVSNKIGEHSDPNLHIYNWAFELVDTIEVNYRFTETSMVSDAVMTETADRIYLTDMGIYALPAYYIDKSELGTGNARIHEMDLSDIEYLRESYKPFYPNLFPEYAQE